MASLKTDSAFPSALLHTAVYFPFASFSLFLTDKIDKCMCIYYLSAHVRTCNWH